jgi:ABC-type sulfate transport system permease component
VREAENCSGEELFPVFVDLFMAVPTNLSLGVLLGCTFSENGFFLHMIGSGAVLPN